jgi:hypothetical protein
MATVYVSIGKAGHYSNLHVPVMTGAVRSETITSSGTSAQGSLAAKQGDIAKINCATAIYVQTGATASATAGQYVAANETAWIGMARGERINVIDA